MSDENSDPTGSSRNVDLGGKPGFSAKLEQGVLDDPEESNQGLFDDLMSGEPIFENKEVLRPSYTPHELPHRTDQINKMATILVAALRGETPSNILIYGKTGTGKTASAKFVSKELESTSTKYRVPCEVQYINCEVTDTQYRVLAQLANKFIEENERVIETRIDELEALIERVESFDDDRGRSADIPQSTVSEDSESKISEDNELKISEKSGSKISEDNESTITDQSRSDVNDSSLVNHSQDRSPTAESLSEDTRSAQRKTTHASDPQLGDNSTSNTTGETENGSVSTDHPEPVDSVDSPVETKGSSGGAGGESISTHPLEGTPFSSIEEVRRRITSLQEDLEGFEEVPMTGWPTDRVYSVFFDAVDYSERVVVIMLDEIDKLVEKSGDDTLYNLSRMNSDLENSRVSIMGISNDLKFTDFLDPRVKSSLGEEEIVFPPYDANQLRDILQHRSEVAFKPDVLSPDVIPLCAAFAAQEHGDARRALDLLRTAGELADRAQADLIVEDHVRQAQDKIELDRVVEVVRTLPTQSKLVLYSIILLEKNGVQSINTGEVFNIYKRLCEEIDADVLTQRRVTDLISELDMLGIVNAVVVSKGRYGRTKEISLSVPIRDTEVVLTSDSRLSSIEDVQPFVQARFDS